MSKYEMVDYDELMRRVGIEPGETWFCGDNPPEEWKYEQDGFSYDDVRASYEGRNQGHGALCLSEDINVNGLLLNHRDRNGTIWLCTGIEGWWTLPPAELPDIPKPYWDGSMLTTGRYLTRAITISGCFIPPDSSLVWHNRDALIRCASIVRGIGLLAMCGNQSPVITPTHAFFDPPKMAIIQMADVPLIETTKPNGFTQFSLSFRSVQPTKLSLIEKTESIPIEVGGVTRRRRYKAISETAADASGPTTQYSEVVANPPGSGALRRYSEVHEVNMASLIPDEEYPELVFPPQGDMTDEEYDVVKAAIVNEYYEESSAAEITVLHNEGNYFAFPIFVFDTTTGVTKDKPLTLQNLTTGERMEIQGDVPANKQLIIDTSLRRVAVENPDTTASEWVWDQRAKLSLTSQWISLAPGDNTIILSLPPETNPSETVTVPTNPSVLWRDTWIG